MKRHLSLKLGRSLLTGKLFIVVGAVEFFHEEQNSTIHSVYPMPAWWLLWTRSAGLLSGVLGLQWIVTKFFTT